MSNAYAQIWEFLQTWVKLEAKPFSITWKVLIMTKCDKVGIPTAITTLSMDSQPPFLFCSYNNNTDYYWHSDCMYRSL